MYISVSRNEHLPPDNTQVVPVIQSLVLRVRRSRNEHLHPGQHTADGNFNPTPSSISVEWSLRSSNRQFFVHHPRLSLPNTKSTIPKIGKIIPPGISKARRRNQNKSLSLGLYGSFAPRTKLDVFAELVVQLRLTTLAAHAVMCDPLRGTVSCSCALLANGDLHQNGRGTKRLT